MVMAKTNTNAQCHVMSPKLAIVKDRNPHKGS